MGGITLLMLIGYGCGTEEATEKGSAATDSSDSDTGTDSDHRDAGNGTDNGAAFLRGFGRLSTLAGRCGIDERGVDGEKEAIAGTGSAAPAGGDGYPALDTALAGVRGVWLLDNGGCFLGTHEGKQVWYVDPSGIIHLFNSLFFPLEFRGNYRNKYGFTGDLEIHKCISR